MAPELDDAGVEEEAENEEGANTSQWVAVCYLSVACASRVCGPLLAARGRVTVILRSC